MKKHTSQQTKGEDDDAQHHPHLITCKPRSILVRTQIKNNKIINKYRNAILMGEGGEYYLGDADASTHNVEFGSQNPSFGNRRSVRY